MKTTIYILVLFFSMTSQQMFAQLSNGSIAPDWTLTDINGNTHHLYDILDQGKTVVLDFSATWCGPCWNYHNTGALEDFYNLNGPNGTNESMVFFMEADLTTGMADLLGQTGSSQGNWVASTVYPIIDITDPSIPSAYQINYFPTIYKVCSDYTIYEVGQVGQPILTNWIQSCTLEASLLSTSGTTCYGLGEGSVFIAASGGYGSLSFQWSNGMTTQNLENAEGGLYYVTITESQGKNVVIPDILVTGPTEALDLAISEVENLLCFGDGSGSIQTQATGGNGGFSYAWNTGETTTAISGLSAGNYQLSVTDANACESVFSFDVEEPPPLDFFAESQSEFCDQANAEISVDPVGGTPPYSVSLNGVPQSGFVFSGLQEGVYDIEVIDDHGCYSLQSITIEEIPAPEIIAPYEAVLDCYNYPLTITAGVINNFGPVSYYWTTSGGNIIEGQFDPEIIVDAAGEYFLQIEDLVTGCTDQTSVAVEANLEGPLVVAGESQILDCDIPSVTLNGEISGGAIDILWTTNNGNIVSGQHTLNPVVDAAGVYILSAINPENGCLAEDIVEIFDIGEEPEAMFQWDAFFLNVTFLSLSEVVIDDYLWDFGNGMVSTNEFPAVSFSSSGTYQVCLTVTNGCGTSFFCQDVTVTAEVGAIEVVSTVVDISCHGASDGLIDVNAAGGTGVLQYQWVGPNNFQSGEEDLSDLDAGSYTLVVTDEMNQTFTVTVEINEPDPLVPDVSVQNITCAGSNDGAISPGISGGTPPYTYTWTTGDNATNLANLGPGTYAVTITDANGCSTGFSQVIAEPVPLEYQVSATNASFNSGGSIDLTISGGVEPYSFLWSNGSTAEDLSDLSMGFYTCIVKDANGCVIETIQVYISMGQPDATQAPGIFTVVSSNPLDKVMNIKVDDDIIGEGLVTVFDPVGKVMMRWDVDQKSEDFNVSGWPGGMYYVVTVYQNESQVIKLVKAD